MKFVKVRDDRLSETGYYGNDFGIAQQNWFASQDPIGILDLALPPQSYFNKKKESRYFNQVTALSIAKENIIKELATKSANHKVTVLACGNGQDTNRFIKYGFVESLNVDNDRVALATLLARRMNSVLGSKKFDVLARKPHKLYVQYADLCDNPWDAIKAYYDKEYHDTCVCNLAIHYFMADTNKAAQFAQFIDKVLGAGGRFSYTCFDGRRVFELLQTAGGEWVDFDDADTPKYKIKRLYTATVFQMGLKIAVKLPFSDEMYEEYLVDIEGLSTIFGKLGFVVEKSEPITGSLKDLNDSDKHYLSLYQSVIMSKACDSSRLLRRDARPVRTSRKGN
jgi:SAM-dependent methyltransferase